MKRSVLHDYNQLEEKLTGYVAMLNFKFLNLCVKAEEASLLPVTVNVDGASKKLEEVAVTAKKDEYRFIIVPHIDEDTWKLSAGAFSCRIQISSKMWSRSILKPTTQRVIPWTATCPISCLLCRRSMTSAMTS